MARTSPHRNGSSHRASQPLARPQRLHQRDAAAAQLQLVLHPHRPQHRRVQAVRDLRALAADRLVALAGLVEEQQPGNLVLVLVRHQLVEVAGDRVGEGDGIGIDGVLGGPHAIDRGPEAIGVTTSTGIRRGRRRTVRSSRRASRRGGAASPAAASTASASTASRRPQRNAAMFRSTATPLSSIARSRNWVGDRHGAGLGGDAEHEDVERRRAAEQPIRDVGRVELAVQLAPRHPIEPLAQGIEGRERGGRDGRPSRRSERRGCWR